jgi:hypothetical protein
MKMARFAIVACIVMLIGIPAFAQEQSPNANDAYYKTVPILKIWAHQLGYMVQFFNSKSQVSSFYVPSSWFGKGQQSRAEIVYGNDRSYPYFTVVWVDGKFDHVTLYVRNDYGALSWGILETATDISSRFNVEEVPREF